MGSQTREAVPLGEIVTAIDGGVDHQVIGIQNIDIAETLDIMMTMNDDDITITIDGVTEVLSNRILWRGQNITVEINRIVLNGKNRQAVMNLGMVTINLGRKYPQDHEDINRDNGIDQKVIMED